MGDLKCGKETGKKKPCIVVGCNRRVGKKGSIYLTGISRNLDYIDIDIDID